MTVKITRKIEFDAGHRIPDHKSKCRNLHGHRYTLEATVQGPVQVARGSDHGMIQDFGDLKDIMMLTVGEPWDHAFLVWEQDEPAMLALNAINTVVDKDGRLPLTQHKTVVLDRVPTVENLVVLAALALAEVMDQTNDLELVHVRLYETPNCWADWYATGAGEG